jgi:hypothetical protein
MKMRVIARKRGVIPGCIPAGQDSHMAVDSLGRPWPEVAKLPSTIDAWLAGNSRRNPAVANQAQARPPDGVNRRSRAARRDAAKSVCNGGSAEHHQFVEASGL